MLCEICFCWVHSVRRTGLIHARCRRHKDYAYPVDIGAGLLKGSIYVVYHSIANLL